MSRRYQVIESSELINLEERVNSLMKEGWRPIGGVHIVHWAYEDERKGEKIGCSLFYQAMVLG